LIPRLISLAMFVCAMSFPAFAADVDLDNDGRTDYQFGCNTSSRLKGSTSVLGTFSDLMFRYGEANPNRSAFPAQTL